MKMTNFRLAIFASATLLIHGQAFSQYYNMTNGTSNTCTGNFYDSGGPSGKYSNDENYTKTFCSCNGGTITVAFSYFNIEDSIVPYDLLNIYDGPNTTSPPVGVFSGKNSPGTVTSSGTCLTFNFISDGATIYPGWEATISCTPAVTTVPTISASGSTTFCPGGNVTLTASSGTSYSWNTGSTTQSIVASTSGSYYVAVGTGSCSPASAPVNVTVKPAPTVTVTGAATICPGTSTSLKVSGGTSYSWAPASSLTNPNISNPYASPTTTTVYSVTATGSNGCTSLGTVTVTTKPAPPAAISGNTSICTGESTTLTASGGGTYSWNTGATTAEITASPSSTANYSVTVTGSNGCTASASTAVTINSVTAVVSASPGTVCSGESSTLTASGGSDYSWNTGQTTSSIIVMPTGTATYSVQVVNANCADEAQVMVTVKPSPAAPVITMNGQTLNSTIGTTYQWYLNSGTISGATNQSYMFTQNGVYSVCVTNASGCEACSPGYTVTVTGIEDPVSATGVHIFPNPGNGSFTIVLSGAATGHCSIDVTNIQGEVVYRDPAVNSKENISVDMTDAPAGIYFLKIVSANGPVVHKIIKQ